jgi:hypothetical protein
MPEGNSIFYIEFFTAATIFFFYPGVRPHRAVVVPIAPEQVVYRPQD